ncbi:alcohol dehydrogenase catalytic domain-containing protein [Streptomyces sp. B21-108]
MDDALAGTAAAVQLLQDPTRRPSLPKDLLVDGVGRRVVPSTGAPSATMRAVFVTQPGGLDALQVTTVPMPEPQPGWVRIKVKAFGVNESEVATRKGESAPEVTYPRIPGIEGVGVVDQADEGSGLRPVQRVATMMGGMGGMGGSFNGSYAQYVTVPAGQVIPFETALPWEVVVARRLRPQPAVDVARFPDTGGLPPGAEQHHLVSASAACVNQPRRGGCGPPMKSTGRHDISRL